MADYDDLKVFNGETYTGMPIGGTHRWDYPNGLWREKKIAPDEWIFEFVCTKGRKRAAPVNSGAKQGTGFSWFIVADQKAVKLNTDQYQTTMEGSKFKVGHKRPHWRKWSFEYPEQLTHRQRVIQILQQTLERLEGEEMADSNQRQLSSPFTL